MERNEHCRFLVFVVITAATIAMCSGGIKERSVASSESSRTNSCPAGYFPCNSSRHDCVRQQFICDGYPDCDDGIDELNCTDEQIKRLFNDYFRKRPDEDREDKSMACDWIHHGCRCNEKNYYCENTNITQLSNYIPPDAEQLDISGNNFPLVTKTFFPFFPNLTFLSLTSSQVSFVGAGAFENLPNLELLHLSGNNLVNFSNFVFPSPLRLTHLVLSHNRFSLIEDNAFAQLRYLHVLDLRNCSLHYVSPKLFRKLYSLTHLWLDQNFIVKVEAHTFLHLQRLQLLSMARNSIKKLSNDSFTGLKSMTILSLAYNNIADVSGAFNTYLPALRILDLEGNKLNGFKSPAAFWNLTNLQSLNLRKNSFAVVPPAMFAPLQNITHIYFSEFSHCFSALHVRVCEPRGDGISSLAHLLDNVFLRFSVWIVALVALLGNLVVLVGRILFREPNEVHSFYIKNLALSDLLMGIYLVSIAWHDSSFRGNYIRYDFRWRHSWQCTVSGLIATVSSEASVLTLTVITVDRLMSIMYPLSLKRRTMQCACALMLIVWTIVLLLALAPIFNPQTYGSEFYSNNGVCLPLHLHNPYSPGWEYSTFLFCGVNTIAFAFIAYAYCVMFFSIAESRLGLRTTQQLQDRAIAKRFAFIVATDFLCWMPIAVVKLVALAGTPINKTLYAWLAVFLLPVNSALNPVLYTLTTRLFKQQFSRFLLGIHHRQLSKRSHGSVKSYASDRQSWSSFHHRSGSGKKSIITILSENGSIGTSSPRNSQPTLQLNSPLLNGSSSTSTNPKPQYTEQFL